MLVTLPAIGLKIPITVAAILPSPLKIPLYPLASGGWAAFEEPGPNTQTAVVPVAVSVTEVGFPKIRSASARGIPILRFSRIGGWVSLLGKVCLGLVVGEVGSVAQLLHSKQMHKNSKFFIGIIKSFFLRNFNNFLKSRKLGAVLAFNIIYLQISILLD